MTALRRLVSAVSIIVLPVMRMELSIVIVPTLGHVADHQPVKLLGTAHTVRFAFGIFAESQPTAKPHPSFLL